MSNRGLMFVVGFVLFAGCADKPASQDVSSSSHEQHASYVEMVSQIKAQKNTIESAFTSGKPDDAHHALHEVGNLLLEISHVAEVSSFGESDVSDVSSAAKSLLDAFGKLDAVMHKKSDDGTADTTYEDVANDVTSGIEVLESKLELPGADVAHADSHEGHGEHGGGHASHADHGEHGGGHDSHADHDEDGEEHDEGHDSSSSHEDDDEH